MKHTLTICFSILISVAQAQFLEFGGGFGALNYSGDLVRGYQVTNATLAGSINNRLNFSEHVSLRTALTFGKIKGSDSKPIDPFARERAANFEINALELSSVFEYHFLDYKHRRSVVRWSPYAFLGFAFTKYGEHQDPKYDFNSVQPSIPFGLGFKHLIGKRFSAGFEFGVRRTFFDYLDNVSDSDDLSIKDYQYGNPNDNDWYSYAGISLSFIIYKIPCPFPYVPNEWRVNR